MKAFIAFLLVLIVAALGYMIWDKKKDDAQKAEIVTADAGLNDVTAVRDEAVSKAILEHRVEKGMSDYEMHKAWGRESRRSAAAPELNVFGIYEECYFVDRGTVFLDLQKKVVRVKNE